MSGADFSARHARQMTKRVAAHLTGRSERGPDRKVLRNSYDVADRRAQVFRPIGDGTTAGALSWIDCLLKTVSEWDDWSRRKGGARPLGFHGLRVLETLLGRRGTIAVDFKTGRLDPAIETIAHVACLSKTTVIRALAKLRDLGLLSWVRRSQKTGNDGLYGPQREQVSNAYFFTPEGLPARVLQRLRDLVTRRKLRRGGVEPPAPDTPPSLATVRDPELRAALERMEQGLNASPPSGLYPCSEQG